MSQPAPQQQQASITPPPKMVRLPKANEIIDNHGHLYFIGGELGEGYFGKVYECFDEWGNELVAKVILPKSQTYEEVQNEWLREMGNLVSFRHPNITYIYDAFEYHETFYLVMERCFMTLADLMKMPSFNGELWLPYVSRDILQALNFIHYNGFAHKDIHPGNVFVATVKDKMVPVKDPVWMFKVGDLGISRLETEVRFFGTVLAQWMLPPEFLRPIEFGLIDRRVDIYHVGLILLRLLTNQDHQFTHDEIVAGLPRQTAEGLLSPYAPVIARALRRHVADRTPTPLMFWREISAAGGVS